MRQIMEYEKELKRKEQEERRNSPILAYLPADRTYEDKQWRQSVEKYLRAFDLIAIPIQVIRDMKNKV